MQRHEAFYFNQLKCSSYKEKWKQNAIHPQDSLHISNLILAELFLTFEIVLAIRLTCHLQFLPHTVWGYGITFLTCIIVCACSTQVTRDGQKQQDNIYHKLDFHTLKKLKSKVMSAWLISKVKSVLRGRTLKAVCLLNKPLGRITSQQHHLSFGPRLQVLATAKDIRIIPLCSVIEMIKNFYFVYVTFVLSCFVWERLFVYSML